MTAILSVPLMAVITVVAAYRRRPDEGLMAAFNRLMLLMIFFNFQTSSSSWLISKGRSSTPLTGVKMQPRQTGEALAGCLKMILLRRNHQHEMIEVMTITVQGGW